MSQNPRTRPPARRPTNAAPPPPPPQRAQRAQRPRRDDYYYAPPRRSDPFPIVMGAIIGALVVGLLVMIYLFMSNNNNSNVATAPPPATDASGQVDNVPTTDPNSAAAGQAAVPRMPLEEFKQLYDDPAKRPIIIDVRAKQAYDEGHIKGAISFPEADMDTRVSELPKDKLVIAYCQ